MSAAPSQTIGAALMAEGLVPPDCFNVELRMPADGVLTLRYEVRVLNEDLPRLIRVLADVLAQVNTDLTEAIASALTPPKFVPPLWSRDD